MSTKDVLENLTQKDWELIAANATVAQQAQMIEHLKGQLAAAGYTAVDMTTAAAQGFRDGQAAAEQRNAELTKAVADAEYRADQGKVWNGMGWTYTGLHSHGQQKVLDILRAALNPTESGASE